MKKYKITFKKEEWGRYYTDLVVAVPDDVDPVTLLDDDGGDLPCELLDVVDEWQWQNGSEDEEIVAAEETDLPPDVVVAKDEDGCLVLADDQEVQQ